MKIILRERGGGKTDELIKISSETWNYIVCLNRRDVAEVNRRAAVLGYEIPFPITYYDLRERRYYGRGINGFLFDNVDQFLQQLTDTPVNAITLSG